MKHKTLLLISLTILVLFIPRLTHAQRYRYADYLYDDLYDSGYHYYEHQRPYSYPYYQRPSYRSPYASYGFEMMRYRTILAAQQIKIKEERRKRKQQIRGVRAQKDAVKNQAKIERRRERRLSKPKLVHPVRTWTDDTGFHTADAQFLSYGMGVVSLLKADGMVEVPLDRLSFSDKAWIELLRKHGLEKAQRLEQGGFLGG